MAALGGELSSFGQLWIGSTSSPSVVESFTPTAGTNSPSRAFSFRFLGIQAAALQSGADTWTRLSIPNIGVSQEVGQPELPVYRRLLFFDRDARLTCNASVRSERHFVLREHGLPSELFPRQRPIPKVPGALEAAGMKVRWTSVLGAEGSAGFQPALGQRQPNSRLQFGAQPTETHTTDEMAEVARILDLGIARGQRVLLLEVFPAAYDAKTGSVILRESVEVEIVVENPPLHKPDHPLSLSPTQSGREGFHRTGEEEGLSGARLLIIAANQFVPLLTNFVAHKQALGWTVEVLDTATTGATASAIRSQIQARYTNEILRPTHLLLAGDTDTIPAWPGKGAYLPATDLYYACMDGTNDWLPDIAYGRFPARTAQQLTNMIAKTIAYENSTTSQTPFVRNAAFIASEDNYAITERTHNLVITQHMAPRAYVSQKLYRHTYSATTADVTNAVNAGCGLVVYSGHGRGQEWRDPLVNNGHVLALTNEMRLPLVMSFACDTGSYRDYDESFAEAWMRRSAPYGAVAVLASSEDTYWYEDDTFEQAVFAAVFEDQETTSGDIVLRAKERYLAYYGPGPETLQYFEQYNLFGDPTVELVVLPINIFVQMPIEVRLIGGQCVLTWTSGALLAADELGGPWLPVEGAVSPWTNIFTTDKKFYRLRAD